MGQVCGSVCGRPQELLDGPPLPTSTSTPPEGALELASARKIAIAKRSAELLFDGANKYANLEHSVAAAEKSKPEITAEATADESKPEAPEEPATDTSKDSGKSEETAKSIDEEQREISAMKHLLGHVSDQHASKGLLEEDRSTAMEKVEGVRRASRKLESALHGTSTPSLSTKMKVSEGPLLPLPTSQPQSQGFERTLSEPDQEPDAGHGESQNNVHSSLAPRDLVRQARSRRLSQSRS